LYPDDPGVGWSEFDSMINARPARGNPGGDVEREAVREGIRRVIAELASDA
jgi:hypothetical protein